ncbi:MAG: hypothetical protein EXR75_05520, partial [Myxococcales bacterium]|nr:hypothetical protein [Myxococcales bacterium]
MFNPFAAPISRIEPRAIAAAPNPARPQFKLLGGGAKVRDDEIDGLGDALEVRVLWQDTLLSVHRVPRGESFFAGDPDLSNKPVQLALSRDVLGAACVPIVVNGCMVISDDGSAHISDGEGRVSLEDARLRGEAVSRADGAGTYTLAVPMGRKVSLSFAGVVIEVQRVRNARRLRGAWLGFLTSAALIYVVGSVVAHAGVLASLAYFTPPLGTTPSDSFTDEQRYLIMRYLDDGATP